METKPFRYLHFNVENGILKIYYPNIIKEQINANIDSNGELKITIE